MSSRLLLHRLAVWCALRLRHRQFLCPIPSSYFCWPVRLWHAGWCPHSVCKDRSSCWVPWHHFIHHWKRNEGLLHSSETGQIRHEGEWHLRTHFQWLWGIWFGMMDHRGTMYWKECVNCGRAHRNYTWMWLHGEYNCTVSIHPFPSLSCSMPNTCLLLFWM